VIRLVLGEAVPAHVRRIEVDGLGCDETCPASRGLAESLQSVNESVNADAGLTDSTDLAFMGPSSARALSGW
jgi:P-type Mg2+ transporter